MDFNRNDRVVTCDGKTGYVTSTWPMESGSKIVYSVMLDGELNEDFYYVHEITKENE